MGMPVLAKRILIADESDVIRRGVRAFLETRSNLHLVADAPDGRTALELALQTIPDIAIIDYSLPDINGYELTISLKRSVPRIEVLIFTMHDRESIILDVLRAGARGFILKSETEGHLFAAINALSIHQPYFSGCVSDTLLEEFLKNRSRR
jgi:DNA-binding NarL/FixJ family response regulator